jgi:hypothetical protein
MKRCLFDDGQPRILALERVRRRGQLVGLDMHEARVKETLAAVSQMAQGCSGTLELNLGREGTAQASQCGCQAASGTFLKLRDAVNSRRGMTA